MASPATGEHDGDMNETLDDPGPSAGPTSGPSPQPPPSPVHRSLDGLRRSTTDRYIAGVAGGLGRQFNIDPTIIRVLLVVLTFFGGAGLVVYVVCWLLVPEDGAEHAPIHVGAEPRKILLLAAAAIAFLLAVGDSFNGFDAAWPFVSLAVILAAVMIVRDRRRDGSTSRPQPPAPGAWTPAPAATTTSPPAWPSASATSTPPVPPSSATEPTVAHEPPAPTCDDAQPTVWQQPMQQQPVTRPPMLPPHPKRTGIVWFWPTLALIGIALGGLAIYDDGHTVADGAYAALALAITGVMLLVGSLVGRPGGLILIGIVSTIALAANVAVGGAFGTDARKLYAAPTSAAQVLPSYDATVGMIELDLTRVSDPQALAGRTIDLDLRTGYVLVTVPRSMNVDINADMGFAGGIAVPGDDSGGINHDTHKYLSGVPATDAAPLELNIDAKFGQITVEQR